MSPMDPLQSWAFLALIGITIYYAIQAVCTKAEEPVWNEREKDDQDLNF